MGGIGLADVRLAEFTGTFSLATDAGTVVPEEHGLSAAAIVELGKLTGQDAQGSARRALYHFAALLGLLGGRRGSGQSASDELECALEAKAADYRRLSEMLPIPAACRR